MFAILGLSTEQVMPSIEAMLKRLDEEDRGRVQGLLQKTLEEGAPFVTQTKVVHGDGTVRVCECRGQARRTGGDKISHVFGSLRVIEDAKPPVT